MTAQHAIVLLAALLLAVGCADEKRGAAAADPDVAVGADATADAGAGDASASDDGVVTDDTTPIGDAGLDAAAPDAPSDVPPETSPEFSPLASLYRENPSATPETEQVELQHLTSEDHSMEGHFALVRNCLPDLERGGPVSLREMIGFDVTLTTCFPTHTALPGADGTYLHITPPADHGQSDDAFAELMMYHHIQVIHDHFKDVHGLADLDFPLDAIVNLQAHLDICDEWASIGNAAFMPAGALDQLGLELDLGLDGDAIVFGQTSNKDLSYDASVIYHEYTHAMVGAGRLSAVFGDAQGLNNLPIAVNEAYADYVSASILGHSEVGTYALTDLDATEICGFPLFEGVEDASRDLARFRSCPEDLVGEVHADGEIYSSALWAIRELLGAELADALIVGAMVGFTPATDLDLAAAATLAYGDGLLTPDQLAGVEELFKARGMLDCERVVPYQKVGSTGIPLTFESTQALAPNPFPGYVPGYVQFRADVPAAAQEIRVKVLLAQGLLGGAGDLVGDMAFKPGGEPILYDYHLGPGSATHDALVTVPIDKVGDDTVARLAGPCLQPGPIVFAIHNRGGGASVAGLLMETSTEPTGPPNFEACQPVE